MADLLDTPLADRAHEALRQAARDAVDALALNVADIQSTLSLTDLVFEYLGQLLDTTTAQAAQIDALNVRCDALQIRCDTAQAGVDALQQQVAGLTGG